MAAPLFNGLLMLACMAEVLESMWGHPANKWQKDFIFGVTHIGRALHL